jgi:hypothetical protein
VTGDSFAKVKKGLAMRAVSSPWQMRRWVGNRTQQLEIFTEKGVDFGLLDVLYFECDS